MLGDLIDQIFVDVSLSGNDRRLRWFVGASNLPKSAIPDRLASADLVASPLWKEGLSLRADAKTWKAWHVDRDAQLCWLNARLRGHRDAGVW
ncbi:hypothetical protein ACICHK_42485 (plasmid) [Streptomyces sp. AHU1]|uniref:hypothetical protein n=1 Tax=Streptomyces sp. AHU1 TaxID=3377215 RepID=UPI003878310D